MSYLNCCLLIVRSAWTIITCEPVTCVSDISSQVDRDFPWTSFVNRNSGSRTPEKNYCKISVVCCSISLKFCICRVVKKKKAVHLHVWRGHRTRRDFWYCIFIFEISNTSMNCTYDLYYIYSWSIALSSQMNTWTITNSLVTKCTQLNF